MVGVINIEELDGGSYNVFVEWVGLEREPSWEPVAALFHPVPQFPVGKLWQIRLLSAVKRDHLRRRYDTRLRGNSMRLRFNSMRLRVQE